MDKYYLRAIRLAAKNKLPDRWIHSQWYQPLDAEDSGTTFVLIEVVNTWFPSHQLTTSITNTFNREYFRSRRVSSAEEAFETAVRRVNDALAARAEEGENDWIGNLHAILAVVSEDNFFLSRAGRATVQFIRQGSISPAVSGPDVEAAPPPQQTFGSIVSGKLQPGDKGIIATPEFFGYVPSGELPRIFEQPLDKASLEMVKIIQERKVKTPHAIIFDFSDSPHAERRPGEEETVYIDQPLVSGLARLRHATSRVVLPAVASGARATGSAAGWFWGRARSNLFSKLKRLPAATASPAPSLIDASPKTEVSPVSNQPSSALAPVVPVQRKLSSLLNPLASLLNWLSGLARAARLRGRTFFIGLAVVLLVVVGLRVIAERRESGVTIARSAAQEALTSAQAKKQEADLALIYNEQTKAVTLLTEALDLARQARQHPDLAAAADEVISATLKSLDSLTKTKRLSDLTAKASLAEAVKLAVVGNNFWGIDQNGKLISSAAGGTTASFSLGSIKGFVYAGGLNRLYAVGDRGVGALPMESDTTSTLTAPGGSWQKADGLEIYGSTLYFLDAAGGQIWKYTSAEDGSITAAATKYFSEAVALSNAKDFAIDGNIYVLFSDGKIARYFKGVPESFTVSGLPKPYDKFTEPTLITTDSESSAIFVFDRSDNRLVELDKSGVYRRQFALPADWQVKDMVWVTEKLWVLAGDQVYEIPL